MKDGGIARVVVEWGFALPKDGAGDAGIGGCSLAGGGVAGEGSVGRAVEVDCHLLSRGAVRGRFLGGMARRGPCSGRMKIGGGAGPRLVQAGADLPPSDEPQEPLIEVAPETLIQF